ncbi:hypothetical protein FKW77_005262 [Venturia effusa]|uniref:Uncharacterized protein n=1 Tax=Venturia effusa TaxID=50376 RepID=A0A517LK77_9PEZI|nr:hypothetical protein FKW77_005262 [Venturia effusa]
MVSTDQPGPPAVVLIGSFTVLPAEIRVKIYKLVSSYYQRALTVPEPLPRYEIRRPDLRVGNIFNPTGRYYHIADASSQFLRCSKLIYVECADVLYNNRFTAFSSTSFPQFEKTIGQSSFSMIRCLELCDNVFSEDLAGQFDSIVNLKTLVYLRYLEKRSAINPMPAANHGVTTDPLLLTAASRSGHELNNGFIDKMATKHSGAEITIKLYLSIECETSRAWLERAALERRLHC